MKPGAGKKKGRRVTAKTRQPAKVAPKKKGKSNSSLTSKSKKKPLTSSKSKKSTKPKPSSSKKLSRVQPSSSEVKIEPEAPIAPEVDQRYLKDRRVLIKSDVPPTHLRIGFLGLGVMGSAMVKNLLATGHKLTIWNRTPEKCKEFVEGGAKQAQTPGDVVVESDIIFSCLSEPQAVKDLIFCNCGVLQKFSPDKGYIELTSIDPDTSLCISEAISYIGGKYLEVPVLGSRKKAEEGTLTLLAAGDEELFVSANSCFTAIGQRMFFLGDVGKACKMNLVINAVMGSCFSAVGEAMAFAERCGIPRAKVLDIFEARHLDCPAIIEQAKSIVEERFESNIMPLQHMQRNLFLALEMGDQFSQPLPTISAVNEVFKHAKRLGYASHDVSAVFLKAHS